MISYWPRSGLSVFSSSYKWELEAELGGGKQVSRKRGEQDVLIELGKLGCYREKRGVIGKKGCYREKGGSYRKKGLVIGGGSIFQLLIGPSCPRRTKKWFLWQYKF